jgi:diadenosine tetraphosphate (Ap4A) HIT family hydrolase
MHHFRKTRTVYSKHNVADKRLDECNFCHPDTKERILYENKTMYVVANRVAYDIFEDRKVTEHLMVIPKKHHDSIQTFSSEEKCDAMDVMGEYESKGYSVYARGLGGPTRSVKHQHTHLIKLVDAPSKLIIYTRKPYVLLNI